MGLEKRALKVSCPRFQAHVYWGQGWGRLPLRRGTEEEVSARLGMGVFTVDHVALEGLTGCVSGYDTGNSALELKNGVRAEDEGLGDVITGVVVGMANCFTSSIT